MDADVRAGGDGADPVACLGPRHRLQQPSAWGLAGEIRVHRARHTGQTDKTVLKGKGAVLPLMDSGDVAQQRAIREVIALPIADPIVAPSNCRTPLIQTFATLEIPLVSQTQRRLV